MRNSFNLLVTVLSISDALFTAIAIMDYSLAREFQWPYTSHGEFYVLLFPKFLYPVNNIIFNTSIFLTIVIAYERYCAVCRPHAYRDSAVTGSTGRRVAGYVVPVIIFSAAFNIPKFLEMELVTIEKPDEETGELRNSTSFTFTQLRNDPDYIVYYINGGRLILTQIFPLASLIYFNINIFKGIKFTHARASRNCSSYNEMNLASVLVCIVIMFLFCHFPRLIINCYEFLMIDSLNSDCDDFMPPVWFLCLTSFMHWLLILNSSSNFIIYCFLGNKFKKVLKEKLRW